MNRHGILSIVLAVIVVFLGIHLISVIIAHLQMLILLAAVGAICRYWGTGVTPGRDLRRLADRRDRHREIDPHDQHHW